MARFVLRAVGTVGLAATLAFFALRALPGDGMTRELLESGADPQVIEDRQVRLGLDQPILVQYIRYMGGILRGDLGVSLLDGRQVATIVAEQIPPTATLAGAALLIATIAGLLLGVASALDRPRFASQAAQVVITLGLSAPVYFTGTLAITIFALWLDILPGSGAGRFDQLILPASVLGLHSAAPIAQIVRALLSSTLRESFITTAYGKGLKPAYVLVNHALRAGLPSIIGIITLEAGFLLSGAVITETVFSRPGIGRILIDAVLRQDYPVVLGVVLWSAIVYIVWSAIGDLAAALVDPRLRSAS